MKFMQVLRNKALKFNRGTGGEFKKLTENGIKVYVGAKKKYVFKSRQMRGVFKKFVENVF